MDLFRAVPADTPATSPSHSTFEPSHGPTAPVAPTRTCNVCGKPIRGGAETVAIHLDDEPRPDDSGPGELHVLDLDLRRGISFGARSSGTSPRCPWRHGFREAVTLGVVSADEDRSLDEQVREGHAQVEGEVAEARVDLGWQERSSVSGGGRCRRGRRCVRSHASRTA